MHVHRIETARIERVGLGLGRVIVGQYVDLTDTVDDIVLHNGVSPLVITRKVLLHHDLDTYLAVPAERIGNIFDIVDREVVVPPLAQVCGHALALLVEDGYVEDVAHVQQRVHRIGQQNAFKELVAEIIRYAADTVGLILPCTVCHPGSFATVCRIDLALHARRKESARIHVYLQVLRRLGRLVKIEQNWFLTDLTLEIVPPVVLFGIGQVVEPHVKVGPEEVLVGGLPHILLKLFGGDALLARGLSVVLDADLLQQVLAGLETARNAARREYETRRQHQQHIFDHPAQISFFTPSANSP